MWDTTLVWAKRAGGSFDQAGNGIAVDGTGNVYVTGRFVNSATFGPGEANETTLTGTSEEIFVAKYNASGALVWAKRAGGSFGGDEGHGVAVDGAGNSYVTGSFEDSATFGAGEANEATLSGTFLEIFVAKYNASGELVWAKRAGGSSSVEVGNGIAVDGTGNSYVTGFFFESSTFGPGEANQTTLTGAFEQIFVAKYDASGALVWAKRAGGSSDVGVRAHSIAADGAGSSYVTGLFREATTFGPGEANETILFASSQEVFVAKYDANGALMWAKRAGGPNGDVGNGIAVDDAGNSYITGSFFNSATFGPGEDNGITLSGIDFEIFVAKYDANGELAWAKRARESSAGELETGLGIAVDGAGNSYVTGHFFVSATFGPSEANQTILSGIFDEIFVAKYDASGTLVWAKHAGGPYRTAIDAGFGISVDGAGNVYVTGQFVNSATFGPGEANQTTLIGTFEEIFVAKYDASGALVWAKRAGGSGVDASFGLAVDGAGNVYVTGQFENSATFGAGEANQTTLSGTSAEIFVAKYDASGALVWAKRAGGPFGGDEGHGIAVDGAGNSYVAGYFDDSATFGAGEANQTTLSGSNTETFIAKYDASGALVWAKRAGGSGGDASFGLAVDGTGNSYVTGFFFESATFGPGEANQTTLTGAFEQIFVAKYDASGALMWAKRAGGSSEVGVRAYSIVVDGAGSSYVTGLFRELTIFGPGEANETILSASSQEVFVAKYDANGTLMWAKRAGSNVVLGNGIAVDNTGNSYVTGSFFDSATFGSGEINETTLSGIDSEIFVAKYGAEATFTPSGSNIVVHPPDINGGGTPVTATFSNVTQAGNTNLTTSSSGPPPSTGFSLGDPATYYELSTTALFTGAIEVCINYSNISFNDESQLKLFHFEDGAWVERTISLDTDANIICASVTSLSPFAIFEPQEQQEGYVVFATNSIWLKQGSDILSGDVLVNNASPGPMLDSQVELSIGENVTTATDFALKANRIKVKQGAVVASDVFYNTLTNNGTINGAQNSPLALPIASSLPPFHSAPAGTQDIEVAQNGSLTLAAGDYGTLVVKSKGTVVFTGGVYNFRSLDIREKAQLRFPSSSEVQIEDKLDTRSQVFVGPSDGSGISASDIIFYVAGINGNSGNLGATPKAAEIGEKNTLFANLYVPNGTLWFRQNTNATGAFLAKDIIVGEDVQLTMNSFFAGSSAALSKAKGNEGIRKNERHVTSAPAGFHLEQNYPNPFNPETAIRFQLPEATHVVMKIFNILGEEVRTLVDENFVAGSHTVRWDTKDYRGQNVPSGVYFYQLATPEFSQLRKMIVAR